MYKDLGRHNITTVPWSGRTQDAAFRDCNECVCLLWHLPPCTPRGARWVHRVPVWLPTRRACTSAHAAKLQLCRARPLRMNAARRCDRNPHVRHGIALPHETRAWARLPSGHRRARARTTRHTRARPSRPLIAAPLVGAAAPARHAEKAGVYDWVAVHDVDEFWFSPRFPSVGQYAAYMMKHRSKVGQVHVHQTRYATNGHAQPVKWPKLLIEEEVMRGPSRHLKEGVALQALVKGPMKEPCKDRGGWWVCEGDKDTKSMWRTGVGCVLGWIHEAYGCRGEEIYAAPDVLRSNHYYLRSVEDTNYKSMVWNKTDPVQMVRPRYRAPPTPLRPAFAAGRRPLASSEPQATCHLLECAFSRVRLLCYATCRASASASAAVFRISARSCCRHGVARCKCTELCQCVTSALAIAASTAWRSVAMQWCGRACVHEHKTSLI